MSKHTYEVIVGNIGSVHQGGNFKAARKVFTFYIKDSKTGLGRSGGEPVTLFKDGEPIREYEPPNKEQIYDAQINPLMEKIIGICKAHKIAMLASFSLESEDDSGLVCTTAQLDNDFDPPMAFHAALSCINQQGGSPMMITVRDGDGNIKSMEAVIP